MRIERRHGGELVRPLPEIRDEIVELRFVRFEEFVDALGLGGIVGLVRLHEQVLHRLVHGSRVLPANGVRVAAELGDPAKQILFDLGRCVLVGQRAAPVRSASVLHVLLVELVHGPVPVEVLGPGLRRHAIDDGAGVRGHLAAAHGVAGRGVDALVVAARRGQAGFAHVAEHVVGALPPGAGVVQLRLHGRARFHIVQRSDPAQPRARARLGTLLGSIRHVLDIDVQDLPYTARLHAAAHLRGRVAQVADFVAEREFVGKARASRQARRSPAIQATRDVRRTRRDDRRTQVVQCCNRGCASREFVE